MAARINVRLKGVTATLKNFRRLSVAAEERLEEAIKDCTEVVKRDAQSTAPVDTGFLRKKHRRSFKKRELRGYVLATAPHAVNVEFGTEQHPAQPFLLPAAERHREECRQKMIEAMGDSIDAVSEVS